MQGSADAQLRMPKQSSGILAAEVDVAMAIDIVQKASLTARHGRWKGPVEKHRSSIAAGQHLPCPQVYAGALRARGRVVLPRLRQGRIEVTVSLWRLKRHRTSSLPVHGDAQRAPRSRTMQRPGLCGSALASTRESRRQLPEPRRLRTLRRWGSGPPACRATWE